MYVVWSCFMCSTRGCGCGELSLISHCPLSCLLQTKLALQKQLTKSLTTGFLPSPLTPPTLCTVATNPLALRHPVGTTTFIQTPILGPALFRPAPGPLRATHTPIIFSPYWRLSHPPVWAPPLCPFTKTRGHFFFLWPTQQRSHANYAARLT